MDSNHRSALESSLRVVEHDLIAISRALSEEADESDYVLFRKRDNLNRDLKIQILDIVRSMSIEIASIAQEFGLRPHDEPVRSDIRSRLDEIWVILEELSPVRLNNYGKLTAADENLIKPHVDSLMNLNNKARKLMK